MKNLLIQWHPRSTYYFGGRIIRAGLQLCHSFLEMFLLFRSLLLHRNAFSSSGRILDPFRISLSPKMLEVLVCTQSWLKGCNDGMKSKDFLDDIHSYAFLEEGYIDKGKDTSAGASIDIIDE